MSKYFQIAIDEIIPLLWTRAYNDADKHTSNIEIENNKLHIILITILALY